MKWPSIVDVAREIELRNVNTEHPAVIYLMVWEPNVWRISDAVEGKPRPLVTASTMIPGYRRDTNGMAEARQLLQDAKVKHKYGITVASQKPLV